MLDWRMGEVRRMRGLEKVMRRMPDRGGLVSMYSQGYRACMMSTQRMRLRIYREGCSRV